MTPFLKPAVNSGTYFGHTGTAVDFAGESRRGTSVPTKALHLLRYHYKAGTTFRGLSMLFRISAAVTLVMASPALATVTLDQSNVATFTRATGNSIGASGIASRPNQPTTQRWQAQTIVAGLSGKLTAVDLQAFYQSDFGSLIVTLGTGEVTTAGYATIGSVTLPHSAVASELTIYNGGFTVVDLSALNYSVTAGQTFTIMLAANTPPVGQGVGNFFAWAFGELDSDGNIVSQADYAPGVNRISTDSGATWSVSGADRGFRTYVDVSAVPEPATWAMMVGGFGVIGLGMRRQRNAVKAVSIR